MEFVRTLLPHSFGVAEAEPTRFRSDAGLLDAVERQAIANAVAKRRSEFIAGRVLARRAMAAIGVPPQPLPVGRGRCPIWPDGVTGSITHSDTWCAAAAVSTRDALSVGIDVEQVSPVICEFAPSILTSPELERLRTLPRRDRTLVCCAMFSAKEATYKALFPLTGQFLEFDAVEVHP